MASSTQTTRIVNTVWKVAETCADTTHSDIVAHVSNIVKVSWWLGEYYDLTAPALEACEVIRGMCANIGRLQQIQRNGYSHMADDGIHTIATKYIPAALERVDWPKQSSAGLENIRLSCAKIGAAARQRQEAHRG